MGEPVNPGFPSPDANPATANVERRLEVIERLLLPYTERRISSADEDGELRLFTVLAKNAGSGTPATAAEPCPFASVYRDGGNWYLRGGHVTTGIDSLLIDPLLIPVGDDGTFSVWVEIDLTANNDEGYALPGIEKLDSAKIGSGSTIPQGQVPEAPGFSGKLIAITATVTVTNGRPTVVPGHCGNIFVTHCPGQLGFS